MNEIEYFNIRDYQIKWNKEEKRNVVYYSMEVFTTDKKWMLM